MEWLKYSLDVELFPHASPMKGFSPARRRSAAAGEMFNSFLTQRYAHMHRVVMFGLSR